MEPAKDSSLPYYLRDLNSVQLKAVYHYQGPLLVVAGAGSGKTRVLTRRIVHLIKHYKVEPKKIMAVTFTNKATNEMYSRVVSLLGEIGKLVHISTFHSAGLTILRRHAHLLGYPKNFAVYDEKDSYSVLKATLAELNIDQKKYTPKYFYSIISYQKNECITPSDASSKKHPSYISLIVSQVYSRYQEKLFKSGAMDFGDLQLNWWLLFKKHKDLLERYQEFFEHILVDEFQDTNKIQYELVKMLTAKKRNLMVVGDEDQSIYSFRGARVTHILDFEKDFPDATVIKLEQNYRSTKRILRAAHSVISPSPFRRPKKLWTAHKEGEKIRLFGASTEVSEAQFLVETVKSLVKEKGYKYQDIAVFYRTNWQSQILEEMLNKEGIPYTIRGAVKFYARKEIKDTLSYLRILVNPFDKESFARAVQSPPRGIGNKTLNQIYLAAEQFNGNLLKGARYLADNCGKTKVKEFLKIIEELESLIGKVAFDELIKQVLLKSGYLERLKEIAKHDPVVFSKVENLEELRIAAYRASQDTVITKEHLQHFLDKAALTIEEDEKEEAEAEKTKGTFKKKGVCLMTLHLAKGLEFPVVFLTGAEEGLLPHANSEEKVELLEEERRLCYVGITRAQELLYITWSEDRSFRNKGSRYIYHKRSRFLEHLPEEDIEDLSEEGSSLTEELYPDVYNSQRNNFSPLSKKKNSSFSKDLVLKVADQIECKYSKECEKFPPLARDEVEEGIKVLHKVMGKGVIKTVKEKSDSDLHLEVQFENFTMPKLLSFKYAELRKI
ncbi:MAG: ATP-dependent DNA helicase PcrA [Candidatus Dadabacteria bacterium]|nr:MAG: ATP-dependent DNA helicase PcrA [Candidatus Dadabacteria bacterium]